MVKQRAHSPRHGNGADGSPTPGMDYASPAPAAKALDAAPHAVVKFAKKVLDFDHRASQVLHKLSLYPFDLIIAPFSLFCGIYSIPFLIPLVAYFESIRLAVVILSSVLLTASITTFLKRLTKRDRPPAASLAHKIFNIRALETNFSFPSGDSAQGAVIACNLFYYAQAFAGHSEPDVWAGFLLLLIPITMSARVYFGAHYWSDTIAGVCIGWLATVTSWAAIEHLLGWKFGSPADRVHAFMSHAGFIKGLHVH